MNRRGWFSGLFAAGIGGLFKPKQSSGGAFQDLPLVQVNPSGLASATGSIMWPDSYPPAQPSPAARAALANVSTWDLANELQLREPDGCAYIVERRRCVNVRLDREKGLPATAHPRRVGLGLRVWDVEADKEVHVPDAFWMDLLLAYKGDRIPGWLYVLAADQRRVRESVVFHVVAFGEWDGGWDPIVRDRFSSRLVRP